MDVLVGRFDTSYTDNISTLKYRRNQFATVNRLPNEILSRIFLLCVDEFERHWYSEWYVWQYLRLTSVCRRWRNLAIDVVQLWTLIDLNCREDLIQMHLSRSKNAKLTVVHSRLKPFLEIGVDVEISLFKELLAPQLHRIVALQLRVSPRLWAEVHPSLQLPAPSLRHLSLTRCHDCALPDEGPESEVLNSQNLFLGQAQLETLDLRYRTQWSSLLPLVGSLRALRLSVGRDSHGALQELITALHFIPTLEYLELQLHDHVYQLNPPPYISATHSLPVVTLPHLAELVIHSTNDAYILDYLITPRLRQCFIKISLLPHPARFLIPLTRCFSFAEVQDMRVVPVAYGPQFCFTEPNTEPARPYADMSQGADFVSTPFRLHPGIQLVIAWLAPSDPGMEFMYTSLMGRAGKLRRLVLQGNIGRRHLFHILKLHVQVLRRASNIRDLVIESHRDILDILELLEDTNVCPQLTTFSCVGCASDRKSFGKQLVAFARARRRSNTLTHIRMSNCPPVANMWIVQLNRLGVELTETDVGQPVCQMMSLLYFVTDGEV